MAEVTFHPEAQAEYEVAYDWYWARSATAARRFEKELLRILGLVADSPHMFPKYDDEHRFAVLKRYPYSVVFRPETERVYVVAVPHAARKPGYWKRRT